MTAKENLKSFRGIRIKVRVAGAPNIRRIYVWDEQSKKYTDPPGGGRYQAARATELTKERCYSTFASLNEAKQWMQGRSLAMKGKITSGSRYTVRALLADWKAKGWPTLKESTQIFYEKTIRLLEPLLDLEVEKLSPTTIDEWLLYLKEPEQMETYRATRCSFEKELDTLKAVLAWYRENNARCNLVSPFRKRHTQMARIGIRPNSHEKFMRTDECRTWLRHLRDDSPLFFAMAVVQIRQVLRVSEVAAMKWRYLDLNSKTYRLCEHAIWPRLANQPARIEPGTKNLRPGDSRVLHLWKEICELLAELKKVSNHELIFSFDGSPVSYRQIQHRYNKAFASAGLPYSSTHVCRHTGATAFLSQSGDIRALMEMGNWAKADMALHYGKILNSRAQKAISEIEQGDNHLRLVGPQLEKH